MPVALYTAFATAALDPQSPSSPMSFAPKGLALSSSSSRKARERSRPQNTSCGARPAVSIGRRKLLAFTSAKVMFTVNAPRLLGIGLIALEIVDGHLEFVASSLFGAGAPN
ncbi:hypothetical protein RGR602_CH03143 [Rhizobium gallicum bv. gallicum R602sp]|uniref:Uncharacterized protein n=1 Tax=Rhizobium gallicum bv. gallicum R602sp TaxID=1041138 RepID=A0A0B4X6Z2_9HYPH|nr:hypothetical protein RGR602_CH03143 [Rhizobium gallicum bv. gallicum R602sp]